MTGVLGKVGQVASLVLLVPGVVAMHAAALLLRRPRPSMRPRSRTPWLLAAGGAVVIVLGRVGL
ncbi:hypothetical protein [Geodermatophilus marinus]|uniref:hypothetical protein n=1 Tax=Geodermatophilus sp. LHW52908 TaxID=2303986 RepID=UPI000E3C168E|nr:hypothetical protein [Geodermatophilus sp. LHW52908]RFU20328.1 hypothetical protein D0Z06_16825 [Geodermatophilus sp. LHW52908]